MALSFRGSTSAQSRSRTSGSRSISTKSGRPASHSQSRSRKSAKSLLSTISEVSSKISSEPSTVGSGSSVSSRRRSRRVRHARPLRFKPPTLQFRSSTQTPASKPDRSGSSPYLARPRSSYDDTPLDSEPDFRWSSSNLSLSTNATSIASDDGENDDDKCLGPLRTQSDAKVAQEVAPAAGEKRNDRQLVIHINNKPQQSSQTVKSGPSAPRSRPCPTPARETERLMAVRIADLQKAKQALEDRQTRTTEELEDARLGLASVRAELESLRKEKAEADELTRRRLTEKDRILQDAKYDLLDERERVNDLKRESDQKIDRYRREYQIKLQDRQRAFDEETEVRRKYFQDVIDHQQRELGAKSMELEAKTMELQAVSTELHVKMAELDTKSTELGAKSSQLEAKSMELETESISYTGSKQDYENQIKSLQADIAKHQEYESAIKERCNLLQLEVDQLTQSSDRFEAKSINLERELDDVKAIRRSQETALTARIAGLEISKDALQFRLDLLEDELAKKTAECGGLAADNGYLKGDVERLQRELDGVRDERNTLESQLEQLGQEKVQLEQEKVQAEEEIGNAASAIKTLAEEMASKETAISDLTTENTELRTSVSDLKTKNAELKANIDGLTTESSELRSTIEGLESDKSSLLSEMDGLKASSDKLQQRFGLLKRESGTLRAQVSSLLKDQDEQSYHVLRLATERESLREENELLRAASETIDSAASFSLDDETEIADKDSATTVKSEPAEQAGKTPESVAKEAEPEPKGAEQQEDPSTRSPPPENPEQTMLIYQLRQSIADLESRIAELSGKALTADALMAERRNLTERLARSEHGETLIQQLRAENTGLLAQLQGLQARLEEALRAEQATNDHAAMLQARVASLARGESPPPSRGSGRKKEMGKRKDDIVVVRNPQEKGTIQVMRRRNLHMSRSSSLSEGSGMDA